MRKKVILVIVITMLLFTIYDCVFGFNGQKNFLLTNTRTLLSEILDEDNIIINSSFEEDVISSNYEYVDVAGWNSPTHDNKILTSKYNSSIQAEYFVELNSSAPNSYYNDIELEKNTNYKFDISHRAHVPSNTIRVNTFDEMAIIFGPRQNVSPSLNSSKKDQFMQMTAWLKENKVLVGNNISKEYVIYSSGFASDGSFETDGFSLTETDEYTQKWMIWFVKSSAYNFFDYTVSFNSGDLEEGIVALSTVSSAEGAQDTTTYGNIIKKFKVYNDEYDYDDDDDDKEENIILDFDLEKIYNENPTIFSNVVTRGYSTYDALNGTTPPITSNWWNVTEPTKKIEFGYYANDKNSYQLAEISKNQAARDNQFVVADNIYQKINIGTNKCFKISFASKLLNPLSTENNRIYIFDSSIEPTQNDETKKTQLDLLSEWLAINSAKTKVDTIDEPIVVYTAPFAGNGLFTVDESQAFSFIKNDTNTIPVYFLSYSNTNQWKTHELFIDLTGTEIENEVWLYFNSGIYSGESNLLDDVKLESFSTQKEFLSNEFEGEGTEENPCLITNEEDFIDFRRYAVSSKDSFKNLYFKQTQNITITQDLSNYVIPSFAGIYDGGGYEIRNIYINNGITSNYPTSIFYFLTGTIKNLGIKNSNLNGWSVAGIVDTISTDGVIENCYVHGNFQSLASSGYSAGIASGVMNNGKILNSYFYGELSSTTIFGVASYRANSNPTFENVFSNITENITGFNASNVVPTIVNCSTKTLAEMKEAEFINTLNEYTLNDGSLVGWIKDQETGLPVLSNENITPELKKLYVKNSDGNDDLYWYLKDNEYYLYLSKNIDRSNMITNYVTNNELIEVYAYDEDGNLLGQIEKDVPNSFFENDKVIIKLKYSNEISGDYIVNVMQSDLPSIYLNLTPTDTETAEQLLNKINADRNHDTGFPGVAYIRDSEDNLTTASFKKMKGRGNATWTYSKRPYQVKFDKSISMLGMKSSKTWLFITNYNDGSLSRSATFYKFAQDLGLDYSVEFETADVYINGSYNGTYLVTSKVERDKNRVDITKKDSLLEMDNYVDTYQFVSAISNHKFTIKYPELDDATDEEVVESIQSNKELIDNLEEKIYDQNVSYEELSEIIDLESFAKAYWAFEISENYDAMYGSTYIYTKDNLVHMGPMWDFDNTLNMISQNDTSLTDYYLLGSRGGAGNRRVRWFNELMKRQEFSDLIDKIFLDNIDVFKQLSTYTKEYNEKIQNSAAMNYSRWPYDVMKSEHPYYMGGNSFEEASSNLISSVSTRVNFYLEEYKSLIISKIEYTTTDVDGNLVTGQIDLANNELVKLPNNIPSDAEIELKGITEELAEVIIPTINLSNGSFDGKVYLTNSVSVQCDKKTNRNSYEVSFEREEPTVKSLIIVKNPNKTVYYEGDFFDNTGLIVNAIYTDNTTKEITDYTIDKNNKLTLDDTTVNITYESCSVPLTIMVNPNLVKSIKITQYPNKVKYIEGEVFNPEGMVLVATYDNGEEKEVTDYTYNRNKLTLSDTNVVISYQGFEVQVNIEVVKPSIIGINIKKNPNKVKYIEGEVFNPEGMVLVAVYDNGEEKEVTDYTYNKNKLTLSDTSVVISYQEFKAQVNIEVVKSPAKKLIINSNPNKLNYIEGEIFNPEGMIVTVVRENGNEEIITDYTYPTSPLNLDNKVIYIEYSGIKVPLTITITKKPEIIVPSDPTLPENNNNTNNITNSNSNTSNGNKDDNIAKEEIKDNTIVYKFLKGKNQIVTLSDDTNIEFETNAKADLLESITINGKTLKESDYTINGETLKISINNDYLKNLKEEENSIEITLKDGTKLSSKFYIKKDEGKVEDTNTIVDNNNAVTEVKKECNYKWILWLIIIILISIIFFIILFKRRKKNEEE